MTRLPRAARVATTGVALSAVVALGTLPSTAAPSQQTAPDAAPLRVLETGLLAPLSVAVGDDKAVYFTQNFVGSVMFRPSGRPARTLIHDDEAELAGVSVARREVSYLVNGKRTLLQRYGLNAAQPRPEIVADLGRYERRANPDGDTAYGFEEISDECAAQWDEQAFGPVHYTGIVDSHPMATARAGAATYVAEAGGNSILRVNRDGTVATTAVLPPQGVLLTDQLVTAYGMPACAEGLTYRYEPVPTDVEVGPDRSLYVTTLAGGLATGAVYRVNPTTGVSRRVADGFNGGFGVAVTDDGDLYVSELFNSTIDRISDGVRTTFDTAAFPAALEIQDGRLFATINALGGGRAPAGPGARLGARPGDRDALFSRLAAARGGQLVRYDLPG